MSLYVRVESSFYTHRKTLRLKALIGNDAFWVPPRLWSYAAGHQPDGCFKDYSCEEIAMLICYSGDAKALLEALIKAGFVDEKPLRVHDWHEYNGVLDFFSKRAKKAAEVRWEKQRLADQSKADQSKAKQSRSEASIASSNASSMYHADSRTALHWLNECSGRHFRETAENLGFISGRLSEPGVEMGGVKKMINRQCVRWKGTDQAEYLRPQTLFNKTKFDGYYAAKDLPYEASQPTHSNRPRPLTGAEQRQRGIPEITRTLTADQIIDRQRQQQQRDRDAAAAQRLAAAASGS